MAHVLLIEDDPVLQEAFTLALEHRGHRISRAGTGAQGIEAINLDTELIVLDLMLPDMDGMDVCRVIRKASDIPIIMLTARGDDIDVVAGLEAGADDYVAKPVEPRVLDARIRSVLRRSAPNRESTVEQHAELVIDRDSLIVTLSGKTVDLTPIELGLLLHLSQVPGRVWSRNQLMEHVWGYQDAAGARLVDTTVGRLRSKLGDDSSLPRFIQTVRGFGYRFGPVDAAA